MHTFPVHTLESAPSQAVPLLESARTQFGFLPHLLGELAEAPLALEGYLTLSGLFGRTSIGPIGQQVVLVAASVANGCGYCVAAHSAGLTMAGLPDDQLAAVRNGQALRDAGLEALRVFTTAVVNQRGEVSAAQLDAFLSAGHTRAQVLEVLLGVSMKTLSNYTNHIAETPLDAPLQAFAWQGAPAANLALA